MEKEFVPFNLAVKLKELGFKRTCLAEYIDGIFYLSTSLNNKKQVLTTASAPLWQQAFDWFRERYNLFVKIDFFQSDEFKGLDYDYSIIDLSKPFKEDGVNDNPLVDYSVNETYYFKYEEARQSCLEKLIEIVEIKKYKLEVE